MKKARIKNYDLWLSYVFVCVLSPRLLPALPAKGVGLGEGLRGIGGEAVPLSLLLFCRVWGSALLASFKSLCLLTFALKCVCLRVFVWQCMTVCMCVPSSVFFFCAVPCNLLNENHFWHSPQNVSCIFAIFFLRSQHQIRRVSFCPNAAHACHKKLSLLHNPPLSPAGLRCFRIARIAHTPRGLTCTSICVCLPIDRVYLSTGAQQGATTTTWLFSRIRTWPFLCCFCCCCCWPLTFLSGFFC